MDLEVESGNSWRAERDFHLTWQLPREVLLPPTTIHYRITNQRTGSATTGSGVWRGNELDLRVASGPGRYTAEVWLQSSAGTGPSARAELLFDDAPPQAPPPIEPAAWARGNVPLAVRIEPPSGPPPLSGIRGYAVSVDRLASSSPCQRPARCEAGEIDLPFGPGPVTAPLGILPEGVNVAHVAAVSGTGVPSAVRDIEVRIDANPPVVELSGVPTGWASHPVRLVAGAHDALSGMTPDGPNGPFTALAVDGGPSITSPGPTVATTVLGEGVHSVAVHARDSAGNVGDDEAGGAIPAPALVRIDATPPRVAFVPTQDPSEPERIEATVADALSGPNGGRGSIWFRAANTRRQFQPIPTAVLGGHLIAHWDSDSQSPGSYEFRATGYDAAGNSASNGRRASGSRMVLANPLKRATALQFGFGGRRLESFARQPAARSFTYGRSVLVAGRLSSGSEPLPGQPVELVETFSAGADLTQRSTIATTGEDGLFLARLAPGPSREVEASFAGNRVLTRSGARRLRLAVPSAVRLHSSSGSALIGGPPVVFRGRIGRLDATVPPSGLAVELQFRVAGSDWSEFRTIQTDRRGRFRYPYAFSDDDSRGARFQFRAFVPAQPVWPYEAGASHPVIVTGR
ncbi:MAG TPA: hypothetical protein VF081_00170 [Solirubrobacterales bacterium]